MALQHQTFSPSTCECVIEEQFEHDEETGLNDQPTLWFFHKICDKHISLAQNKSKPKNLTKLKDDIIKHQQFLLESNRARHLKEFDNNPVRKQKHETIKELKKSFNTEQTALRLESQEIEERRKQESFLDNHEVESLDKIIIGVNYPHAFVGEEVYDAIRAEQKVLTDD